MSLVAIKIFCMWYVPSQLLNVNDKIAFQRLSEPPNDSIIILYIKYHGTQQIPRFGLGAV